MPNGTITIISGDITHYNGAEAIVTSSNSLLSVGSGLNAAVHRWAGPKLAQCLDGMGSCRPGKVKVTKGFNLEKRGVKYIIHAVGPRRSDPKAQELLGQLFANIYEACHQLRIHTVAIPAIGTKNNGWDINEVAKTAVQMAVLEDAVNTVFVLDPEGVFAFKDALAEVQPN